MMPNLTVRIDPDLDKALTALAEPERVVEKPLHRAALRVQRYMADYPPARLGSTYVRTGTLGRRWTVESPKRNRGQVSVKIGNNTEYGPFVQSKRFQAGMHRGRWQTDEMAIEYIQPRLVDDIEREVRRVIGL